MDYQKDPVLRHGSRLIRYGSSLIAILLMATVAQGEEAAKKVAKKTDLSTFVRVNRNVRKQPVALETAVTRYVATGAKHKGVVIELVSAIHVGDREYYDNLNKRFEGYDVVLYELVAPKKHRIKKGAKSKGAIGMLQNLMKDGLGLEHQISHIDYNKDNFVHADVTPKEFAESMKKRGESFFEMYFKMMGSSMAQQLSGKGPSDAALLAALFSSDRTLALKRIFAEALINDGSGAVLDGPGGSTILTVRNQAALKVLGTQIKAKKKRIAIFYGAAHMPDLERRLLADFAMRRDRIEWIKAWDMDKSKKLSRR
jgi:hypothetical protein